MSSKCMPCKKSMLIAISMGKIKYRIFFNHSFFLEKIISNGSKKTNSYLHKIASEYNKYENGNFLLSAKYTEDNIKSIPYVIPKEYGKNELKTFGDSINEEMMNKQIEKA